MSRSYTSAKRDAKGLGVTFDLDDITFTCAGQPTALDLAELAEIADLGVDTEDPRAVAAIGKFFRAVLGPAEYARFKAHTSARGTDGDVFIDIMSGILEDVAARPTGEPSRSPDGPSTTGPGPRVVSLSRRTVHLGQPGSRADAAVSSPSPSVPSSTSYSLYG